MGGRRRGSGRRESEEYRGRRREGGAGSVRNIEGKGRGGRRRGRGSRESEEYRGKGW